MENAQVIRLALERARARVLEDPKASVYSAFSEVGRELGNPYLYSDLRNFFDQTVTLAALDAALERMKP